jgi:hypothetical protein
VARKDVDARVKRGHDEVNFESGLLPLKRKGRMLSHPPLRYQREK